MIEEVWTEFYIDNGKPIYYEQIYSAGLDLGCDGISAEFFCNLKFSNEEDDVWRELHFTGTEALNLFDKLRKFKGLIS